jgi:hypothetical protein
MLFDIIKAQHVEDYKINIAFENGQEGIVDLKEYCNKGGLFNNLKDKSYFMKFYVNRDIGTICWPDGLDIAPETLLAKL